MPGAVEPAAAGGRGASASSVRAGLGVYIASLQPHSVSPARLSRPLLARASVTEQRRFQDPGASVYAFADEFAVVCPRCERQARVVAAEQWGDARLTCANCGLTRYAHEGRYSVVGGPGYAGPLDWYFGLPLWLRTRCCGNELWARNQEHLGFLRELARANLRERPRAERASGYRNKLMASRMPQWFLSSKNREEVLRCLDRLQGTLVLAGAG